MPDPAAATDPAPGGDAAGEGVDSAATQEHVDAAATHGGVTPLKTLVSIATYNEIENVEALVASLRKRLPAADVLVIDDNSPDGTGDAVRRMAADDAYVHGLHRAGKLGLGTAYLAAFEYAAAHGYDVLVTMDSDFSHDPDAVASLVQPLADGKADLAIGSRYIDGGGIEGWPRSRHVMSRCVNTYTRLLFGTRVADCSGGFRAYRVAKLAEVDWSRQVAKGYAFLEEVLFRCERAGLRTVEVPILFRDREQGTSKISLKEAGSAVIDLARVCWRDRIRGQDRKTPVADR